MRFQERFELATAIQARDNEISITGTEVSSGRPVTVHLLLEGKSAETVELLRNISGLSGERRQQVLDEGDFDGIPYVVTYPLPASASLRAWISAPEAQRSTQVLRPAGYKTPEPGEFTRLFQARAFEPLRQPSPPSSTSPAPDAPSEPAPRPGEFTALMSSFSPQKETFKAPAAEPAPRTAEKPPAPPPANDPGEFTVMMRSPLAPVGEASAPKPPAKSGPGEFTLLVNPDLARDSSAKPKPASPPQPVQPPSHFTQIIQKEEPLSHDLFSSAAPIASQLPSDGLATGAFSRPAVPAEPAPMTGPSEFTRIASSPAAPASPVAAPPSVTAAPQAKAPPPKRRGSYAPLIIILTAVVIIAVILIAVFTLQR